jgi:type IV secretory pathway TrbD component
MRPTYRVLNKHLTLCGADRQLFLSGLFVGFGLFATFSSVIVGAVTFLCFTALGWLKARDPIMLRMLFNPGKFRNQYDPAIRRPFPVVIYGNHTL